MFFLIPIGFRDLELDLLYQLSGSWDGAIILKIYELILNEANQLKSISDRFIGYNRL